MSLKDYEWSGDSEGWQRFVLSNWAKRISGWDCDRILKNWIVLGDGYNFKDMRNEAVLVLKEVLDE